MRAWPALPYGPRYLISFESFFGDSILYFYNREGDFQMLVYEEFKQELEKYKSAVAELGDSL